MKDLLYKHAGLLTVIWTLLIFVLCLFPGQYIPTSDWLDLLSIDKLVHATLFFALSFFFVLFSTKKNYSKKVLSVYLISAITYGGLLELMQAYIASHRSADVFDFIANSMGVLLFYLFKNKILRRLKMNGF